MNENIEHSDDEAKDDNQPREHGPESLYEALNEAEEGDILDFVYCNRDSDDHSGAGVYRVDEKIGEFGDSPHPGMIICRNDVDDRVTTIKQYDRDGEQWVFLKEDNWEHFSCHVDVEPGDGE